MSSYFPIISIFLLFQVLETMALHRSELTQSMDKTLRIAQEQQQQQQDQAKREREKLIPPGQLLHNDHDRRVGIVVLLYSVML